MDDPMPYFNSQEIFTLTVGPGHQKLYVTRPILRRIPFFQKALEENKFKEAKTLTFDLLEDDPKTVANILCWSLADSVKSINVKSTVNIPKEQRELAKAYVKAFVTADKFMAENVANLLISRLVEYHKECAVEPAAISILSTASLQNTKLYSYLVEQIVVDIKRSDSIRGTNAKLLDTSFTNSEDLFAEMSSKDLTAILVLAAKANVNIKTPKWTQMSQKPCASLHTHQSTKKCFE